MTNVTIVSKLPEDEFFVISFTDLSKLHWFPENHLLTTKDGFAITHGPRFDSFLDYRRYIPVSGGRCCLHAKRKHCVCAQFTVCPVHGARHQGSHE